MTTRHREYYLRNRERRIEKTKELVKAWRAANPERDLDNQRQWQARNKEYIARNRRAYNTRLRSMISQPRTGPWSAGEDALALREDLTLKERAVMLQRPYEGVRLRVRRLHNPRPRQPRPKKPAVKANCTGCGHFFVVTRDRKKYCSLDCWNSVQVARKVSA